MTYLGLDIGTSAVKAVLVDEAQRPLALAEVPLETSRPRPHWSEQPPEAWWQASRTALAGLRTQQPAAFAAVRGLGLSGQMHAAVLLDAGDRVLRPAILWNDGRAQAESRLLNERVPEIGRIAGVPAVPNFTAPKLLWLATHEPEILARTAMVLSAKDYVRLQLTGERVTDMADAAGTSWLDQGRRAWSQELLAACGMTLRQMPRLVEGSDPAGTVRPEAAANLGLPPGVVVAGGAGDTIAGSVGIGAIEEGQGFVSLGTSSQYFVATDTYRPFPQALIHAYCHALPGRWLQMAALLNGASCLAWAARLLGESDIAGLLARVEAAYAGPGRVLFLPYLVGERTPHDDPHARGVLFGLDPESGPLAVVQAVLEGVACSLAEAQDCVAATGTEVASLAAIGGGARSRLWLRILASALDRPITLHAGGEKGPAFGAARLARLAVTGEAPAAVCGKPEIAATFAPEPALVEGYRAQGERWRRLYRALRAEFKAA